jgi:hypothetical protein
MTSTPSVSGKGFRALTKSFTGRKAVLAVFQRAAHEGPIRRALLEHIQDQEVRLHIGDGDIIETA